MVLVTDKGGSPLPGAAVTFTAPTSGASGTFSGGSASVVVDADNNGRATSPAFSANTAAGSYTVSASAASASFTITPGAAAKLAFTTDPSASTVAGSAFASQPVVKVQDTYGNTVTGDTSSVTLAVTGGGATVSCTANPLAASAGVATFAGCTMTKAGTWTLTATAGALASAASASFAITPGAAAKLAFIQQPGNTSTVAGSAFASQPVVALQDTYGNLATSSSGTISLAITAGTGTSGAALSCTTNPLATASGLATFAGCKINLAGNGYTLTASGPFTAVVSTPFIVAASLTPTSLALVNAGSNGIMDVGDSIVITYSTTVKASTFCSDWTSDSTAYSVTDGIMAIGNNTAASGFDQLTFSTTPSCGGVFNVGTIDVGTIKLTLGNASYRVTFAWDPSLRRMTITVGAPITATTGKEVKEETTVTYSPSATITDPFGGVIVGTSTFIGRVF